MPSTQEGAGTGGWSVIEPPPTRATPPRADEHDESPPRNGALRRSKRHRMLAGVAGGIAERFDVDVSLVRVAFVVLACAWGAGALLYLSMWALVPSEVPGAVDEQLDDAEVATPSWLAFLLLAGVLAFGLLIVTSWFGGPRWGGGVGLLWVVILVGLLVVALRDRSERRTLRRAIALVVLGCMTLVILAAASFLGLVASTGVPMSGGIGERIFQPTSLAELHGVYRTSIGNMTVDLRQIHFPSSTTHVTATVAVGQLTVEVPPGVVVDVNAHAGVGTVSSSPVDLQAFSRTGAPHGSSLHVLDLVAEVGVGRVILVQSAPG